MVIITEQIDTSKLEIARNCLNCARIMPDEAHHCYCLRFKAFPPAPLNNWKCRAHKFFHELTLKQQDKMRKLRNEADESDERCCESWNDNTGKCDISNEACAQECGHFHYGHTKVEVK